MLTARQYADKYPGQIVKLSPKYAKDMGLSSDNPIGIIVGFRPGQKGVIGSSKVAVWRDKFDAVYGLEAKTKTSYHSVVLTPPDHRLGVYFLSVNYIELARPMKSITTYPHRCKKCGSPARNGANLVICSNANCKSNKAVLKAIGPIPKFHLLDKDGYLLCPTCQFEDKVKTRALMVDSGNHKNLTCMRKTHRFVHSWKDGQKLNHQEKYNYVWKNATFQDLRVYKEKKK